MTLLALFRRHQACKRLTRMVAANKAKQSPHSLAAYKGWQTRKEKHVEQ